LAAILPPFGFYTGHIKRNIKMDELFNIIGRLYADLYHSQKLLDVLQEQIKNKEKELADVKKQLKNEQTGP
jgi:hypothetical protein